VADCTDSPGTGKASVANCCDPAANEWTFQTCNFSELFVGETSGDLIPGKDGGGIRNDCLGEWAVNNPLNVPFLDRKGFPNVKQKCMDGDPLCDADGEVNGSCLFEMAVCLNVEDARLVTKRGLTCNTAELALWQLKKPRPDSRKAVQAANARRLRDAVLALAPGTIGGKYNEEVLFSPGLSDTDQCTDPVMVEVPLRGRHQNRQGKATVRMLTLAKPLAGERRGAKDRDTVFLTCLPSGAGAP